MVLEGLSDGRGQGTLLSRLRPDCVSIYGNSATLNYYCSMAEASALLFSALLKPNRSATLHAINVLIVMVAVIFFATGLGFAYLGAWPVAGFIGLDVVLLYVALRINHRAGSAFETVSLTTDELTISRVDHWGRRQSFALQPHWLQVSVDKENKRVELRSHGRAVTVGAFLTPEERAEFADALREALRRLKTAPFA
jgi:uncharacterized membrane protein